MSETQLELKQPQSLIGEVTIRPITSDDNVDIAQVIRHVLIEMDAPREGSAFADPSLDYMFQHYEAQQRASYFVAERDGKIIAGCGFGPLPGEAATVCELQKMYLLAECRGLGIGQRLVETCLQSARALHYEQCYLETLPNMLAAQALYQKMGFVHIDAPMGNTGHCNCPVWMLKDLVITN